MSKQVYAQQIYDVIKDYRSDDGYQMTIEHIIEWADQFGDDSEFVLMEVAHIIPQVYASKADTYSFLKQVLAYYMKKYNFKDLNDFLYATEFLVLQPFGKSQWTMLGMIDEIIFQKISKRLQDYNNHVKSIFIYVDDILATGKTIGDDLCEWLSHDDRAEKVKRHEISLNVALLCFHDLGVQLQNFRISKQFDLQTANSIDLRACVRIQNHLNYTNPTLNIAVPIRCTISKQAEQFYDNLTATKNAHQAFRRPNQPAKEVFLY